MITRDDLQPGDIIVATYKGQPFHFMIYSPGSEKMCDVIHMGYGFKRSGAVKSNLTRYIDNLYRPVTILSKLNIFNKKEFIRYKVIRSKKIDAKAIANQAEYWLRQGVVFDERRVAWAERHLHDEPQPDKREATVLQYLKFAARRDTAPVKAPVYPYTNSGILALIAAFIIHPVWEFSRRVVNYFADFLFRRTNKPDRPHGFTCVGFVSASIGAAALKGEINPVDEKSGWVSLKHGKLPETKSSYRTILKSVKDKQQYTSRANRPGLDTLLTEEQLQNFNIDRLADKLTPLLANSNPFTPSPREFLKNLKEDTANWEDMGVLIPSKLPYRFDKNTYHEEQKQIEDAIQQNRKKFVSQFSSTFFNKPTEVRNNKLDSVATFRLNMVK